MRPLDRILGSAGCFGLGEDFREREGHLNVPQRHIEQIDGEQVRLGQWLSNLRRRRSSLSPQRRAALDELGL
ncbi:helicase associated domain-containing protein [Streptomyces sp. NPDC014864]|uniref:helicase associated domain-containing protein n=1 Tax=Streptomyces sp. NPDC014864 TaxID=3364924 RepID=UPI0036FF357E